MNKDGQTTVYEICMERDSKDVFLIVEFGIFRYDGPDDCMKLLRDKYPSAKIVGIHIFESDEPVHIDDSPFIKRGKKIGNFEYYQLAMDDEKIIELCKDADIIIDDLSHNKEMTKKEGTRY